MASIGQAFTHALQLVHFALVDHPPEEGAAAHQPQESAQRAEMPAPQAPLYPGDGEHRHEHEQDHDLKREL